MVRNLYLWSLPAEPRIRQVLLHLEGGELHLPRERPSGLLFERDLGERVGCNVWECIPPAVWHIPVGSDGSTPARQSWWWVCLDEIERTGRVCHHPIAEGVRTVFAHRAIRATMLAHADGSPAFMARVWYHGTHADNLVSIRDGGLRASPPGRMLGAAVYLGDFYKAVRFGFHHSDWSPRKDHERGAVVRVAVLADESNTLTMGDEPCECHACSKLSPDRAAMVDHHGKWMHRAAAALVPSTTSSGAFFMARPELAVQAPFVLLLSAHELDLSTRSPPHEPYNASDVSHRIL